MSQLLLLLSVDHDVSGCFLYSYTSVGTWGRLRPGWNMGAGRIDRCDCGPAVSAVSAAAGGCVPLPVPQEGLQPQTEAGCGGPFL